jgi:tetratricopeptide (TPR) repeat protein
MMSDSRSPDDSVRLCAQAAEHERLGAYQQARTLVQHALEVNIHQHGLDDPATIACFHQAAHLEEILADYPAARTLAERALCWSDASFGRIHPTTATSAAVLSHVLGIMGQSAASDALMVQAVTSFMKGQRRYALATARALVALPSLLHRDQNYALTLPLYTTSLSAMEKHLGSTHPDLISLLKVVAWATTMGGKTADATPLLDRALALAADHLGITDLTYADLALERGQLAVAQMQLDQARDWYRQALAIRQTLLPAIHIGIAECLTRVGSTEVDQEAAQARYQAALAITEQVFGPDHPAVATALVVLGRHLARTDLRRVRPYYERACAIWERTLGAEHAAPISLRQQIAML